MLKPLYVVRKTVEFAAAHQLLANYAGPCERIHGHNYKIGVEISANELDKAGMVIDFKILKQCMQDHVLEVLDHRNLNTVSRLKFEPNPTAEVMAREIYKTLVDVLAKPNFDFYHHTTKRDVRVASVRVWETPTSSAEYIG